VRHFTPKFRETFEKVLEIAKAEGEQRGRLAFRTAMLELGHEERIQNLYRIQNKLTKKAEFFRMNKPQRKYLDTKAKRNIILKCRQVGFTTLNCIRALDLVLWEANMRTGILCHKKDTVMTIFKDITKFSYDWFKKDWSNFYKPNQVSDSASTLSFSDDGLGRALDSSIRVMYDFRGKTLHFLHVSEAAFIENKRLTGSVNGVPLNGEVTYESTANGMAGEFYRLWQLWRTRGKTAPCKGFFIPWYSHYPEIEEEFDFEPAEGLTAEEVKLLENYRGKITNAHINWRRWCIDANCEGDAEVFEVEYPSNDEDCFLSNGASVFPKSITKMQRRNTRDPVFLGFLMRIGHSYEIKDDQHGIVAVWEAPEPDATYVIGADPSGGVGKDNGAAYIKNQKTKKHVARLWGDLTPADFARELYKLGMFYNKAWICVESNNYGHVVIHELKRMGYHRMYKRRVIDELTNKPTKKVGFLTTNESKLMITEKFKKAAQSGGVIVTDKELISEMSTFIQISGQTGRTIRREASPNAKDDLVIAASLTEEMDSTQTADSSQDMYMKLDEIPEKLVIDSETGFPVGEGYAWDEEF